MPVNGYGIIAVTGRAHCQRQVAFFNFFLWGGGAVVLIYYFMTEVKLNSNPFRTVHKTVLWKGTVKIELLFNPFNAKSYIIIDPLFAENI